MTVTLKAKHLFLIASQIKTGSLQRFLTVGTNLRNALNHDTDLEEEISIECSVENFTDIYTMLGQLSESLMAAPNKEMTTLLLPQIQQGIAEGNEEWMRTYTYMGESINRYNIAISSMIEEGKNFLLGPSPET